MKKIKTDRNFLKMSAIAISCMSIPNSPIKFALVAVLVTALVVSLTKWELFYDVPNNKLRDMGTSPGETIFPAWMAMFSVGFIVYMLAATETAFKG